MSNHEKLSNDLWRIYLSAVEHQSFKSAWHLTALQYDQQPLTVDWIDMMSRRTAQALLAVSADGDSY